MTGGDDTRARILRAALRVIGEAGVAGLTNRRVAKEAGLSLGSLTYHFASQTELLRDSLLLFVEEEAARITALADSLAGSVTDIAQAAAVVEQITSELAFGRAEIGAFEVYIQAGRDPELHDAARRCYDAYDHVAVTVLGMLGIAEPQRAARAVVALISGMQLRRLATGAPDTSGIADALLLVYAGAAATEPVAPGA